MKKIICFFLTFFIVLISAYTLMGNRPMKPTIKIAGDNNYPPFEFVNESGVYRGFNNDIIQSISVNEELDIEILPMAWHDAVSALENGEVDALQGMTISKERKEKFDFTESYIEKEQVIFVLEDNNYVSEISDLYGKRVSFQESDISLDFVKDIEEIEKVPKENQQLALMALVDGEVEAFIGDRLTGMYYLQRESLYGKIKIVGEPLEIRYYAIAVKKGDKETLEIFERGLKNIRDNGTHGKIYHKWFGEVINDQGYYLKRIAYILTGAFLVSVIIILIYYYTNKNLKYQVVRRTERLLQANKELALSSLKLENNYNLLNNIIESTFSGIFAFDKDCRIVTANTKALNLLEKAALKGCEWQALWISDYFDTDPIFLGFKGESTNISIKREVNRLYQYFECAITPVISADQEVSNVVCILADRTEETKIKDMLSREDKMSAMGHLTTSIAHELRNPLTAIKAYVELIPEKIENPDFRKHIAAVVPKEIDRMNALITSLLEYSKPKSACPEKEELGAVIKEAITLFEPLFKQKNIKINYKLEDVSAFIDKNQIKQALVNIIINSMEAMEKGKIEIRAFEENERAMIEIEDNGPGIPKEQMNKIFDVFYTYSKKNGTGMGLSIAYTLIKENGGDIFFTSTLNEKTTARIALPVFEEKV